MEGEEMIKNNHYSISKREWKTCPECGDLLGKYERLGEDNEHCRHCYTKLKHGSSDINNCFQGSVITLDE